MGDGSLVGRRVGEYEVGELLGRGAFADVYRAVQSGVGREVALKVLDPVLAEQGDVARRFREEGRVAARLEHPNIIPVYESGTDNGVVFLAMRLIEGESLADRIERDHGVDRPHCVWIVRSMAGALDRLHQLGLVHRDVKPGNILIESDRVWLTDFGISVSAELAGRYTTGPIGTALYMAPEQAEGQAIDGRADLYSLACVLYECLTGRPPFVADSKMALLLAHLREPAPPTGDPALDSFFASALAKVPAGRPATGAAFADALERAFAGEIVPVGPPIVPVPPTAGLAAATIATTASENIGSADATYATGHRRRRALAAAVVACLVLGAGIVALVARSGRDDKDLASPPSSLAAASVPAGPNPTGAGTDHPGTSVTGGDPSTGPSAVSSTTTTAVTTTTQPTTASTVVATNTTDPQGIGFDTPAGWASQPATRGVVVDSPFVKGGAQVARILNSFSNGVSYDEVLAKSNSAACATTPTAATIGGLRANHCITATPSSPLGPETEQWSVFTPTHQWIIEVATTVPPAERDAFIKSIAFGNS